MNEKELKEEIQDNIAYNESSLDYIGSTPLTEGGMDFLVHNINDITFHEDCINEDWEDIDVLEDEDKAVLKFFGINPLDYGKEKL